MKKMNKLIVSIILILTITISLTFIGRSEVKSSTFGIGQTREDDIKVLKKDSDIEFKIYLTKNTQAIMYFDFNIYFDPTYFSFVLDSLLEGDSHLEFLDYKLTSNDSENKTTLRLITYSSIPIEDRKSDIIIFRLKPLESNISTSVDFDINSIVVMDNNTVVQGINKVGLANVSFSVKDSAIFLILILCIIFLSSLMIGFIFHLILPNTINKLGSKISSKLTPKRKIVPKLNKEESSNSPYNILGISNTQSKDSQVDDLKLQSKINKPTLINDTSDEVTHLETHNAKFKLEPRFKQRIPSKNYSSVTPSKNKTLKTSSKSLTVNHHKTTKNKPVKPDEPKSK
jgi:hypothetical protein